MQVFAGNFVVDGDPTAYERQRDAIKNAIITYGADHVTGVTVGNEFMLKSALLSLNPVNINSFIQLPQCSQC
jgi:exo-beta-1,3-glucanase (GH17 family)